MNSIRRAVLTIVGLALAATFAPAQKGWDSGTGADGLWNTGANWTGDTAPVAGDNLIFGAGATMSTTNDLAAGLALGSISFTNSDWLLTALDATRWVGLARGITNNAPGFNTNAVSVAMTAAQSILANQVAGTLVQSGDVTNGGFLVTFGGVGTTLVSGAISGNGGLTKSGTGFLWLGGANSYTGTSTIGGGVVQLGHNSGLGSSNSILSMAGGILDLNGYSPTVRSPTGNAGVITNGGAGTSTLTMRTEGNALGARIRGDVALNLVPGGIATRYMVLSGDNDYTGLTTMSGGAYFSAQHSNAFGATSSGTIINSGSYLELRTTTLPTLVFAAEPLTMNDNSRIYGFLDGASRQFVWTGPITLAGATATAETPANVNLTLSGDLGGSAQLLKTGAGLVTLDGAGTWTGGTAIRAGTLAYSLDTNIGGYDSGITVTGGVLRIDGAAVHSLETHAVNWSTFNGGIEVGAPGNIVVLTTNITGTGAFTKNGPGTLVLMGPGSTYAGSTSVSNGVLRLAGGDDRLPAGSPLTVANLGVLDLAGHTQTVATNVAFLGGLTHNGTLVGTASAFDGRAGTVAADLQNAAYGLAKSTAGTLTLLGNNSYAGGTVVSGGVLSVLRDANLGAPGGALTLAGGNVQIVGNYMTGFGARTVNWNAGANTMDIACLSNAFSLATVPSGAATLTKIGGGSLVTTVPLSYSGLTTVSAGTMVLAGNGGTSPLLVSGGVLQIGNGGATGDPGLAPITNNSALAFRRSDAFNYTGSFVGTGQFRQLDGSGPLTLSGTNTMATMMIGGGSSAAPLILPAGSLQTLSDAVMLGNSGVQNVATYGRMEIQNGATLVANHIRLGEQSGATGEVWQTGGYVQIAGQVRVGHYPNNVSTYTMDGGTLRITAPAPGTNPFGGTEQNGALYLGVDGTGVFNQNGGEVYASGLVLDNRGDTVGIDTYTLTGGLLSLGGWGIQGNASTLFNAGGGTISAYENWTSTRPIHLTNISGNTSWAPPLGLTITLSNSLYGGGTFVKDGFGQVVLLGTNTYAGPTLIQRGALAIANPASLPAGSLITIGHGGSLAMTGLYTTAAGWLGSGLIATNSGGGVALSASTAEDFDFTALAGGVYTGIHLGAASGDVYLTGTITPAGNSYLLGGGVGRLLLTNDFALAGSRRVEIANGGTVLLQGVNNFSGGTVVSDDAVLSLSRPDQIGGVGASLRIEGGGVQIRGGTIADFSAFTGSQTNFTDDAIYDIANLGNVFTEDRDLTGGGALLKRGQGTLVLGGSNSFAGAVSVANGVLRLTDSSALAGAPAVAVSGIVFGGVNSNRSAVLQISGGITVTNPLTIAGQGWNNDGALRSLDAGNTYAGSITFPAGLQARIQSDAGLFTLAGPVTNNAAGLISILGGAGNYLVSGVVTGAGALGKDGGGTATLTASNLYTGGTYIYNGTLSLDFSAPGAPLQNIVNPASGTVNMNGGTLRMISASSGANTQTFNNVLNVLPGNSALISSNTPGGAMTVNLNGAMGRGTGAGVLDISGSGEVKMFSATNIAGLHGANMTVNRSDFAAMGPTSNIVAFANYNTLAGAGPAMPNQTNAVVRISNASSGNINVGSTTSTIHSLLLNDTASRTIAFGAGGLLRLSGGSGTSGAILMAPTSGALTIGSAANEGLLTTYWAANAAAELILINNSANALTVNSAVINNGTGAEPLTIAGTGAGGVNLNGTNLMGGRLYVDSGTVNLNNTATYGGFTSYGGTVNVGAPTKLNGTLIPDGTTVLNINAPVTVLGANNVAVGQTVNSRVLVNLNADLIVTNGGRLQLAAGNDLAAAINQTAGVFLNSGNTVIGDGYRSWGGYRISGGTLAPTLGQEMNVGYRVTGVMDILGGSVLVSNANFSISRGDTGQPSIGIVTVDGGLLGLAVTNGNLLMNYTANSRSYAQLSVVSGAVDLSNTWGTRYLDVMATAGNTGIVSLVGGSVTANMVRANGTGLSVLNFDGGRLVVPANSVYGGGTMSNLSAVYIHDGGATFDIGTNATFRQDLSGVFGYGLTNLPVANGGAGYLGSPSVRILGGSGTGATAVAQVDLATGLLTNILITSAGSGYLPDDVLNVQLYGGGYTTAATLGAYQFGAHANTGGLTKEGAATLTIVGSSSYGGLTTINNGALVLANPSGTNLLTGGIAGAALLEHTGAGMTIVGGNAAGFSGALNISNGVMQFATMAAVPAGFQSVNVGPGGAVAFDSAGVQGVLNSWQVSPGSAGAVALTANTANEDVDFSVSGHSAMSLGAVGTVTYGGTLTPDPFSGLGYHLGGGGGTLIYTNAIKTNNLLTVGLNAGLYSTVRVPNLASNVPVTVYARGILDLAGTAGQLGSLAGSGVVTNSSSTAPALFRVGYNNNSTAFGGNLSGTQGLMKVGAGTLTLSGINTYSGGTIVGEGTVKLAATTNTAGLLFGQVANNANYTSINPGTNVALYPTYAFTNAKPPWVDNVTWCYDGYLMNYAGSNVTWTIGGLIDDSERVTIDGQVLWSQAWATPAITNVTLTPGAHRIEIRLGNGTGGAGAVASGWWSVANMGLGYDPMGRNQTIIGNYTGFPRDTGDGMVFATGAGLGPLPDLTDLSVAPDATLDMNGVTQTVSALRDYAGGGGVVTNTGAGAAALRIATYAGSNATFSGSIGDDGVSRIGLGVAGAGVQSLSGTNSYSGGTVVYGGTLKFDAATAVPATGNITVNPNGTAAFDFTGVNAMLGRVNGASSGSVAVTATSAGDALNFAAANLSNTFLGAFGNVTYTGTLTPFGTTYRLGGGAGVLDYAPPIAGANSLLVGGGMAGIVSLTNANTYSGGTFIQNGILRIGSDAALGAVPGAAATNVTFNYVYNNGLLGGVLQAGANGVALDANRTILVAPNAFGTVDVGANTMTINGSVNGAGGTLAKVGAGTLVLGNATNLVTTLSVREGAVAVNSPVGFVSNVIVGAAAGDRATLRIADNFIASGRMYVGSGAAGSAGAVVQTGGTNLVGTGFDSTDVLSLGMNGGYGYYRLEDGVLNAGQLAMGGSAGPGSIGVYEQFAGSAAVTRAGGWLIFGWGTGGGSGVLNLYGGSILSPANNNVTLGYNTGASFGMINLLGSGALLNTTAGGTARNLEMMRSAGNLMSVVNLDDGVLLANAVVQTAAGLTLFNFDGGTLRANSNLTQAAFMQGLTGAYIYDGGAVIDTVNSTIGINQPLLAPSDYGLTGIAVTNGGAGYIGAPVIRISGGSGTGATAVAQVDLATGTITNIMITSAGTGYQPSDVLTISLSGGGATAEAALGAVAWGANSTLGGLVKLGSGTLALGGNNTYGGGTTILGGTLQIGNGGASGSVLGGITNAGGSGNLAFGRTDVYTNGVEPQLVGFGGSILQNGAGVLVLTNPAPVFSSTVINAGNVFFSTPAAIPGTGASITNNVRGAVVADGAYTTVGGWLASGRIATNSPGAIALDGGSAENINMAGYATLSLGAAKNAAATYVGTLTPASNTYYLGGGGGVLMMGAPNQLVDNGRTNRNLIVGNGGGGLLSLMAPNTYNGGTILTNGTLSVNADQNLGSGNISVYTSGSVFQITNAPSFSSTKLLAFTTGGGTVTLDVGAGSTATWYGVIGSAGGGFVHKQGGGVLILSNAAFFAGSSVFEKNGTTIIDNGGGIFTGGSYHNVGHAAGDNATLIVRGSGSITNNADFNIADTDGFGTMNVQDSAYVRGNTYYVGKAGTGTVNQTGGDIFMNGSMVVGNSGAAMGRIFQSGGTLSVSNLLLANTANNIATNNLSGGVQTVRGTYLAKAINTNTAIAVMNLVGGTLRAGNNFVISNLTTFLVGTTGAYLDSSNYTITVNQSITGAVGTLTKLGSGTVMLNNYNVHGTNMVNAGLLRFGSTNGLTGGRSLVINPGGAAGMTNAVTFDTNFLFRISTVSAGTLALGGNNPTNLNFAAAGLAGVSLGAAPAVTATQSGAISPAGLTFRLGGGGGTLIVPGNLLSGDGTNLVAFGGGSGGTLRLLGDNTFLAADVNGGLVEFAKTSSMGAVAVPRPVSVNYGGSVAPTGAVDAAFLNRLATASAGAVALNASSVAPIDFNAAGLSGVSLGAANGAWLYTGTLTPYGSTYRLGGGEGMLTLPNANQLTGARNLVAFGAGSGGLLALANTNDYSGGTWIGPTGMVGGATVSFGSGPITNMGALLFSQPADGVLAGTLSGNGTLYVSNSAVASQLILTNSNPFSGPVYIQSGVLALSNLTGRALESTFVQLGTGTTNAWLRLYASEQMNPGVQMSFNGANNSKFELNGQTQTVASINNSVGTLSIIQNLEAAGTGMGLLIVSNSVSDSAWTGYLRNQSGTLALWKDGAAKLALAGANITYTGPTVVNNGLLLLSNTTAFASPVTINGGSLGLGTATAAQNIQITNHVLNGLSFLGTNAFTIGALNGTGSVALLTGSGGAVTLTLGGNNQSGSYLGSLTDAGPGNYYMGSIVKIGTGTQALVGANSHRGSTTISAGGLLIERDENLGAAGTPVILNGGTLLATNSLTLGDRPIAVTAAGGRFGAATNMTMTLTNSMSGTGTLAMNGLGTLVLAGDNSNFTGNWNMMSGIVRVTHSYGLGAWGVGQVNDNIQGYGAGEGHALELSGGITVSGKVLYTSGSGYTADTGVLRNLDGTNQWLAPIILTGGAGGTTIASDSGLLVLGGSIAPNTGTRTLTFGGAGDTIAQGGISNGLTPNLPVFKNGLGTVTFAGDNAYSGQTVVNQGTLQVGNGGTSGVLGTGLVTNFGVLAFNRGDAVTVNNLVTGSGELRQIGLGTTILTASHTYTGQTWVSAGTLALTGTASLASSASLRVDAPGRLDVSGLSSTMHLVANQTLLGTGTVKGGLITDSAATVAPGVGGPGTLSVDGNWQMDAGSVLDIQLNGLIAGPGYDNLVFNGNLLTLNNPTLNIALGFAPAPGSLFTIVSGLAGTASGIFAGLPDGTIVTNSYGGNDYPLQISYNDALGGDPNNDITLTVIPEPAAFGLIGLGMLAFWIRRRRMKG